MWSKKGGGVRGTKEAEHRETEEQLDHQGSECLYEGRHVRTYPLVYMYACVCVQEWKNVGIHRSKSIKSGLFNIFLNQGSGRCIHTL